MLALSKEIIRSPKGILALSKEIIRSPKETGLLKRVSDRNMADVQLHKALDRHDPHLLTGNRHKL